MASAVPQRRSAYHHGNLRAALIQSGVELARRGGPQAVVLREVGRQAGVSATAAYRHFHGLPDLVSAVAQEALTLLARNMQAQLADLVATGDQQVDALARLTAVGRGYVSFALAEPGLFATAFVSEHSRTADLDSGGNRERAPYQILLDALAEMAAAGLLADGQEQSAAVTAWAAVHGLSGLLLGPLDALSAEQRDGLVRSTLRAVALGLAATAGPTAQGPWPG